MEDGLLGPRAPAPKAAAQGSSPRRGPAPTLRLIWEGTTATPTLLETPRTTLLATWGHVQVNN